MGLEKSFGRGDVPRKGADFEGENRSSTLSHQNGDFVGESVFRTLLVAPHTSLVAAIDDYGIVYVVRASDHVPGLNNSVEKSTPQFQQLRYRTLAGWEVGGADISHQRLYNNLSPNLTFVRDKKDKMGSKELPTLQGSAEKIGNDSVITGFSAASQMVRDKIHRSELSSGALRSIFLPTDKHRKDDIVCLSPFGITRLRRNYSTTKNMTSRVVHCNLHVDSAMNADKDSNGGDQEVTVGVAVGCTFHGCFYLVTEDALSVVLPSISVASGCIPVEAIGYHQKDSSTLDQTAHLIETKGFKQPWPTWKIEVLDRVLLYEGHEEADHLCLQNGWDLKVSRIRRLQLALDYLNFQEIEISLEMLAGVSLAEEGVLRLVFAAVYLMLNKGGNDSDVSAASRLLSLGTHFSTKMIRGYGSLQHMQNGIMSRSIIGMKDSSPPLLLADKEHSEIENLRRLQEMARLLEITRNMQRRLATKFKKSATRSGDGLKPLEFVDSEISQDDPEHPKLPTYASSLEIPNEQEYPTGMKSATTEKHALMSMDSFDSRSHSNLQSFGGASTSQVETEHMDANQEPHDTFEKVRDIGRAIAYDLFLKEILRKQITEVMKAHGYLGPYELKILEGISSVEFLRNIRARQKELMGIADVNSPEEIKLPQLHSLSNDVTIECGELDGVVLGVWRYVSKYSDVPVVDDDDTHACYWAAAAVWSDAWDQRTIDRGPIGWQSVPGLPVEESFLLGDVDYVDGDNEQAKISTLSWEAAIQRHAEELYGPSAEGSRLGLEHHLHRGRALAAFIHLLSLRVKRLKLEFEARRVHSDTSVNGQSNIQSDVHTLLSPITQEEESLLSSVMPLAVMHFEDSVLVASCAFLLELCGLSPSMLQVDIAALRRISSFFKSVEYTDNSVQPSFKGSVYLPTPLEGDITGSLARALAEYYLKNYHTGIVKEKDKQSTSNAKQAARALVLVLQNLEKASLPSLASGETCGSWLMSGIGDGAELRSQQKAASQHWSLVTEFCRMHQIPMSTKYLAVLAKDNDWVGFLSESQVEGHPLDTVIQVASKEFSDPCLRVHISTVLKGMQSRKNVPSSTNFNSTNKKNESSFLEDNNYIPVELFGIIADCEKQKNPGEALLLKAKDLCWSVLAMVASCFPDVSPLCCLTVWLEITAARETSSIKVNDIASQISSDVAAAVETNNFLPVTARAETLHYNRRNPKRRRLMESVQVDTLTSKGSDVSTASSSTSIFIDQGTISRGESKDMADENKVSTESDKVFDSLSKMVAVLCEQRLFLPLLRAFEMFLPSCSLLPFIRALQDGGDGGNDGDGGDGDGVPAKKERDGQRFTAGGETLVVTVVPAESMVAEWKEFLWDVPEERVALWGHCQMLFIRYSFPPLQAGLFFLKHAEAVDKDLPPKELHELLLLSLQWLSGMITQSAPVYPLHLLRELETRVWLLAVESEAQVKSEGELTLNSPGKEAGYGKGSSIVDHTANMVSRMDNHINTMKARNERNDARDHHHLAHHHKGPHHVLDAAASTSSAGTKSKRRTKGFIQPRKTFADVEKAADSEDTSLPRGDLENSRTDSPFSRWEESIGPAELERAVLSLLEFGQIAAARQLQHKLSPSHCPSEFVLVDAALKLAAISTPSNKVAVSMLDDEVRSVIQSRSLPTNNQFIDPMQVLESLTTLFVDGRGRGLCKRLISVVKAANVLGLSFSEAFDKNPVELLQLLSLKAQDSFKEAYLLIQTHPMPAASIAQILAESF
ncbi:hypothetical protein OSB04_017826 [Centaurea solstitialis]|uniref:Spatacsin C-terminal domain-containing protein n=1 Tax=Centaurea solstitialis TaxID=347529 RepID=A0AA38TEK3_9ASTR|nr:hypothetical protein OSB04_017826 [Centaurea solstitialis]